MKGYKHILYMFSTSKMYIKDTHFAPMLTEYNVYVDENLKSSSSQPNPQPMST